MGCCNSKDEVSTFNYNLNLTQTINNRTSLLESKENSQSQARLQLYKSKLQNIPNSTSNDEISKETTIAVVSSKVIKKKSTNSNVSIFDNNLIKDINDMIKKDKPVSKNERNTSYNVSPVKRDRDSSMNIRQNNYKNYQMFKESQILPKSSVNLPSNRKNEDTQIQTIFNNPIFNINSNENLFTNKRNRESTIDNVNQSLINETKWSKNNFEHSNVDNSIVLQSSRLNNEVQRKNYYSCNFNMDKEERAEIRNKLKKDISIFNTPFSARLTDTNAALNISTHTNNKIKETTSEIYQTAQSIISSRNINEQVSYSKPKESINKYKYIFTDQV